MSSVNQAADAGAARAESLMVDTCRIYTEGDPVLHPVTGANTRPQFDLYTGPCRARPSRQFTDADAGQTRVQIIPYVVSVPLSVTNIVPRAFVEMTASRDASLVGKLLSVVSIARGTHITARRLECEEVA